MNYEVDDTRTSCKKGIINTNEVKPKMDVVNRNILTVFNSVIDRLANNHPP